MWLKKEALKRQMALKQTACSIQELAIEDLAVIVDSGNNVLCNL
jgi:hypothetical protein